MSKKTYSISINDSNNNNIFNGIFTTNNKILENLYDHKNLNKNLLVFPSYTSTGVDLIGYPIYISKYYYYDNVYDSSWKQFDYSGIILSSFLEYTGYE